MIDGYAVEVEGLVKEIGSLAGILIQKADEE